MNPTTKQLVVADNQIDHNKDHVALIERIENALTRRFKVISGTNNEGDEYESISEFWYTEKIIVNLKGHSQTVKHTHKLDNKNTVEWYQKARTYWNCEDNAPATIDGMLGGYSELSERDLSFSKIFVEEILADRRPVLRDRLLTAHQRMADPSPHGMPVVYNTPTTRSCECGAGIGRVTKGLLLPLGFEQCDLVETSPRLIQEAPRNIGHPASEKCNFINCGLEEYHPAEEIYDLVWIQWVIGYLTDYDCVQFLQRIGKSLRKEPKGMIIIKDNTCREQAFVADKVDSSLTRSLDYLLAIIEIAGLRVISMKEAQGDFPSDIFPVPMIALECID